MLPSLCFKWMNQPGLAVEYHAGARFGNLTNDRGIGHLIDDCPISRINGKQEFVIFSTVESCGRRVYVKFKRHFPGFSGNGYFVFLYKAVDSGSVAQMK